MKKLLSVLLLLAACAALRAADINGFADAAFRGKGGMTAPSNRFEIAGEFLEGKTTRINTYVDDRGLPIMLGGKTFRKGFGVHADSILRFILPENAVRFTAAGGIDSHVSASGGSCRGSVYTDGKKAAGSPVMKGDAVYGFDVPLKGAKVLELRVDNGGDGYTCDHWSWGDPVILLSDGRRISLSDMAAENRLSLEYPFRFTFGGRDSRDLLPGWSLTCAEKRLSETELLKTFVWSDPETKLEVKAEVRVYADTNALDYTLWFTNRGEENTPVISDIRCLDLKAEAGEPVPVPASSVPSLLIFDADPQEKTENDALLIRTQGTIGCVRYCIDDFRLLPEYLQTGKPVKTLHQGLSSCFGDYAPYWTLKWSGGGAVCGMGWTGSWFTEFSRDGRSINMAAGRDGVNTYLKPGETIRSPRMVMALFDTSDLQEGMNLFRMTMINHISPRDENGDPVFLPLAATLSGKESNASTETIDREYIRSMRDLSFETTWFDAWYQQDGFPACMGNLHYPVGDTADKKRYPHSLKPLTDLSRAYGKTNLVWFGPETVNGASFIAREHPEYVMWNRDRTMGFYALSDPEAREYIEGILGKLIKDWKITYFRTDSSTDRWCMYDHAGETAPDRQGIYEDIFVSSLYSFWDELREQNPGLIIDNCAGGGTRIDVELMSRSINMARSDSSVWVLFDDLGSAMLNQQITSNLNFYIPWSLCATLAKTPYSMRSCFNTGLAYIGDPREEDCDKKELEKGLQECLRLRKYHLGHFYTLFTQDNTAGSWMAWQYSRPEKDDGYFVIFRREESPFGSLTVEPRNIRPDKKYRVDIYRTYDLEKSVIMKGSELAEFTAAISEKPGSLLAEYYPAE
ncbi:MAG: NPCBM/NEW2 domain-containing protein [Abditibacteriota bacterium]|nr:NPCBM/NEW2 domain-containing protein [Abditibacteriota bacterium]